MYLSPYMSHMSQINFIQYYERIMLITAKLVTLRFLLLI